MVQFANNIHASPLIQSKDLVDYSDSVTHN